MVLFGTLLLVLLLILLAIAELGVRTRMYFKYDTFWGFDVKAFDPASGLMTPKPNYASGPIKINSLGFRSPELQDPRPDNLIRLAFLGGSTTFCQEVSGNHMVWPDILTRRLQKNFPEQQFDYINASATAYTLGQSLTNLEKRVALHEPQIVVIYHAVNDIGLNGNALVTQHGQKMSVNSVNPLLKKLLNVSLLADLIYKNVMILLKKQEATNDAKKIPFDEEFMTSRFRDDLQALVSEALKSAKIVVIPTFSNRLRKHQSPEQRLLAAETHLFHIPYFEIDDLLLAFDRYNEVIREFADNDRVLIVETESVIEGTTENFIDSVHFTDIGSTRMGEHLAKELSQSDKFQNLLSEF